MSEPKGAPAPAPRPSAPTPRIRPAPTRVEATLYLVGGVAFGDLAAKGGGQVDAGSLIHALTGRLHVRPLDALVKAVSAMQQKAYEVRVTVEVLGEVNAAVVPHNKGGETA